MCRLLFNPLDKGLFCSTKGLMLIIVLLLPVLSFSQSSDAWRLNPGSEDFRLAQSLDYYYFDDKISFEDRLIYSYDGRNNLLEERYQAFIEDKWVDNKYQYFLYDDRNLLIEKYSKSFRYRYGVLDWMWESRKVSDYNLQGQLLSKQSYTWSASENDWRPGILWTYSYSPDGRSYIMKLIPPNNRIQQCHFFLDENFRLVMKTWYSSGPNPSSRSLYVYDDNGNLIRETYQRPDSSKLQNLWKSEYTFVDEQLYLRKSYSWQDSTWIIGSQNIFEYNDEGNLAREILQIVNSDEVSSNRQEISLYDEFNNPIERRYYNWDQDHWSLSAKNVWVWERKQMTGIFSFSDNNLHQGKIRIYPNPSQNETTIELNYDSAGEYVLRIFNQFGQLIWEQSAKLVPDLTNQVRWNGGSSSGTKVSEGVYFVEITTENERVTQRLVRINK